MRKDRYNKSAFQAGRCNKLNWHPTLNDSLQAENLVELWPLGSNIQYGETVQHIVEDGKKLRLISVYRSTTGSYERAVSYLTT